MGGMDDAATCLTVGVPTPGGPVAVRVWPASDAAAVRRPVLLACHGWAESGAVFGPLAAMLHRHWTVVAPDAPGHGDTRGRPPPGTPCPTT